MIETTLGALVVAEPVLARLTDLRLPVKVAYHLMKLATCVSVETRHYEQQRVAFVRELGVTAENGQTEITPLSDAWPEFVRRMTDLAAVPVTLAWKPITLEMLDAQPVSANDLAALGPLCAQEAPADA